MNDQGISTKADADQVDACRPHGPGEATDTPAFIVIYGVDGVATAGRCPDFDHDLLPTVPGDEIDLTVSQVDVAINDSETLAGEPPDRDILSYGASPVARVDQSLSSVFSSFSTLTSRKVSTCTFSRNRAGRNMSQTQASVMVTSK